MTSRLSSQLFFHLWRLEALPPGLGAAYRALVRYTEFAWAVPKAYVPIDPLTKYGPAQWPPPLLPLPPLQTPLLLKPSVPSSLPPLLPHSQCTSSLAEFVL